MQKNILFIILIGFLISCAPKEMTRLFDLSLEPFKSEGKIYSEVFNLDKNTAYQKVIDCLQGMKATIYRKDPKKEFLIALGFQNYYPHCSDTTEIAVFFTSNNEPNKTKIEVSSLNYQLSEAIAKKLWEDLNPKLALKSKAKSEKIKE